jgi:dienelactone hydrolase
METLALSGIDCYLCDMPLNFALLGRDAAGTIRTGEINNYGKWYIGGHSLGGVAAAMAADDAEEAGGEAAWDGLVLLASYPTEEISTPVISIYGTEDKVLNTGKYNKTKSAGLWPSDFTEVVIKGGNHAQFGNYGEQKGDGSPAITAAEQQKETADVISEWAGAYF